MLINGMTQITYLKTLKSQNDSGEMTSLSTEAASLLEEAISLLEEGNVDLAIKKLNAMADKVPAGLANQLYLAIDDLEA